MAEKKNSPYGSESEGAITSGTTEVERLKDDQPDDPGDLSDEPEPVGEEQQTNDEEVADEDAENVAPVKKPKVKKKYAALEYDLKYMYPEMNVLTEKNKNEWNYEDPKTIRALWLEAHTNALAEWKIKYAKIKRTRKPLIEVRDTASQYLRNEYRKNQRDKEKETEEKLLRIIERGHETPKFSEVKLPTNTTTDLRYRYNRNNPPIPLYYLVHFDKHKKPPFKLHGIGVRGCRTFTTGV